MTDAEIIKALECCIKDDYYKGCAECPVRCFEECDFHLAKFALDLIKRQQAEIKKLESKNNTLTIDNAIMKSKIGSLEDDIFF